MTCRGFVSALDDFVSADADVERLEALDAHVAGCPACAAYMATYLDTSRLGRCTLRCWPPDEPALDGLVAGVLARWSEPGPDARACCQL